MKARVFILTILTFFVQNIVLGQTTEFQYFYHPEYFTDSLIKEKAIKKISVMSYWTMPTGKLYQQEKNVYTFNESGNLLCSESYYFKEDDPQVITQQTIDCYEYRNGLQSRHLRYHSNKDSAEWIEEFQYVQDHRGNITKIMVKDLSHPQNSNTTEKVYDSNNRIITEKTNFGYLTEYRYDAKGNLIEKIWGAKERLRNKNIYSYDAVGNLIKYEFKGIPFCTDDIVKEINKYDSEGRIILKNLISAGKEKSLIRYSYEGENTIKAEFVNQNGEVYSATNETFLNGLIQSKIMIMSGAIHSKEVYEYEFHTK